MSREWNLVGEGTPLNAWLETRRDGEKGENICFCRIMSIGDEPEWIEKSGGRTTVTHTTFAAPTHWRWPEEDTMDDKQQAYLDQKQRHVDDGRLKKRPVAFRYKDGSDQWVYTENEAETQHALNTGHDAQGLYARDGT